MKSNVLVVGMLLAAACGGNSAPTNAANAGGGACAPTAIVLSADDDACGEPCRAALPEGAWLGAAALQLDGDTGVEHAIAIEVATARTPSGETMAEAVRLMLVDDSGALLGEVPFGSSAAEPQSEACTGTADLLDDDCDGVPDAVGTVLSCQPPMCAGPADDGDADLYREICGATPTPELRRARFVRGGDGMFVVAE